MPRVKSHAEIPLESPWPRRFFLSGLCIVVGALGMLLTKVPPLLAIILCSVVLGALAWRLTGGHMLAHWWHHKEVELIHAPRIPKPARPRKRETHGENLQVIHQADKPARRVLG